MTGDTPITILLVDDEAVIAMATKMSLEAYGYRVLTAFSGEKAVQAFKKLPDVDLILMDINLGTGMDGTEAAGVIMAERDLPVVFLSSHTEPEIVAKTENGKASTRSANSLRTKRFCSGKSITASRTTLLP